MISELVLNKRNGAFTLNTFDSIELRPYVCSYTDSSFKSDRRESGFKFLTIFMDKITFSSYRDYSFVDWKNASPSKQGFNYNSYIVTGYLVGDDFAMYKQSCYLTCLFDRTEREYIPTDQGIRLSYRSGCVVQGLWDWHGDDSMWSKNGKEFSAYKLRHDLPEFSNEAGEIKYPEDVIITKNKLRGRGRSLSLRFSSEDGKDMKLIGWHIPMTQVDKV